MVAENVAGLTIDNLKTLKPIAEKPAIELNNVQDVFVHNCFPPKSTVFLLVKGNKTSGVVIKGNSFNNVLKPLVKEQGVTDNVVVE